MTNVDPKIAAFLPRFRTVRDEKKQIAEMEKDLKAEAKSVGLTKTDIAGILLALKREDMTAEKRADHEAACEVADMLAGSGTAPLFAQ